VDAPGDCGEEGESDDRWDHDCRARWRTGVPGQRDRHPSPRPTRLRIYLAPKLLIIDVLHGLAASGLIDSRHRKI